MFRLHLSVCLVLGGCGSTPAAPVPHPPAAPLPASAWLVGSGLADAAAFLSGQVQALPGPDGPMLAFAPASGAPLSLALLRAPASGAPCGKLPQEGWAWVVRGADPARVLVLADDATTFVRRGECWVEAPLEPPRAQGSRITSNGHFEPRELPLAALAALGDPSLAGARLHVGGSVELFLPSSKAGNEQSLTPGDVDFSSEAFFVAAFVPEPGDAPPEDLGPSVLDVTVEALRAAGPAAPVDTLVIRERAQGTSDPSQQGGGVDGRRETTWTLVRDPSVTEGWRTVKVAIVARQSSSGDGVRMSNESAAIAREIRGGDGTLIGAGVRRHESNSHDFGGRDLRQGGVAWRFESRIPGAAPMWLTPEIPPLPVAPGAGAASFAADTSGSDTVAYAGCTFRVSLEQLTTTCAGVTEEVPLIDTPTEAAAKGGTEKAQRRLDVWRSGDHLVVAVRVDVDAHWTDHMDVDDDGTPDAISVDESRDAEIVLAVSLRTGASVTLSATSGVTSR